MMAETVLKKGAGNPLFGHGDPCRWSSVLGRAALDNNSILRQLLLVGVGTTTLLAEQLKKAADELVQKGQLSSEEASNLLNNLLNQVKSEQSNLESYVQRQVRNVLQDLGVPCQSEMDELRGRLDRLERQVRNLENQLYRRF
jgi:polyhydroxyalkanoate synthesis regulator phasin